MAVFRAKVQLGDTEVEVEAGSPAELREAIESVRGDFGTGTGVSGLIGDGLADDPSAAIKKSTPSGIARSLIDVVNAIKESDRYDAIESRILDKKPMLPRVLLCSYFANKTLDDPYLTTSQVETITHDLGVRIKASNVSGCFTDSGRAYFTADRVRRKGVAVRYKINRAGIRYVEGMLEKA
jgi:hypothetical protein